MAVKEERRKPKTKPKPKLGGQMLPLLLGVVPIFLMMGFMTRGGAGLHKVTLVVWLLAVAGCLSSVAYHLAYRAKVPKSVIYPHTFWRTLPVAAILFGTGLLNLWGSAGGWALQLTSNETENPGAWMRLLAKLLLRDPVGASAIKAPVFQPWVTSPQYFDGALWGALGFAAAFGIGGLLASAFRKEAFDPRQEPFGSASFWPILRSLIGFYFGWALGFGLGIILIRVLSAMTSGLAELPPTLGALAGALGAVPDPNRAFTSAFIAGCLLLSMAMIFLGRGDFTVAFSDPKPAEKEPPMKVTIPELPKTEPPNLDFGALAAETEQLAASFGRDLTGLVRQMGFAEEPMPAFEAPASEEPVEAPEPPAINLISARKPEFDTSFDQALGQLANVYVQISAQLGHVDVSLAEWLTLEEGSLIEMPRATDGTISLCINGRHVGRAKPAVYENHVAIKVLRLEPGTVDALKGGA